MDSPQQNIEALRLLHGERSKASLDKIANRLAALITGGSGQTSTEETSSIEANDHLLRELHSLSKSWNRLGRRKKLMEAEGLWNRLLDACYNEELESLKQQGYPEKSAKKLVRREQAWWETDSRQFETGLVVPQFYRSVPVVVVQREASFRIHDEILPLLWQHPVFAEDVGGAEAGSPREAFMNTLGSVEAVAQEYSFNDWEYFPSPEELDGPDRSALACMLAGLELESMLTPIETGGSGFLENEAPTHGEELAWLGEAKKGERLWILLNAAVKLGQSLNHYATFQGSNIEEAIRRIHTAGKKTTEQGDAVECIIRAAKDAGLSKPTPKLLLKWLGGEKDPLSDGKPLRINHRLWGKVLAGTSWERFESLVKSAGRRSSPT